MSGLRPVFNTVVAAGCLSCAGVASAQAQLQLSFTEPTGTAFVSDPISILVTLKNIGDESFSYDLDPGSLTVTGYDKPLFGNNFSLGQFNLPFASYDGAWLFIWRSCGGENFATPGCNGGPYSYEVPAGTPSAPNWFSFPSAFSLDADASETISLYDLLPRNGLAPEGDYFATSMGVGITISGVSTGGVPIEADWMRLSTCDMFPSEDCQGDMRFARTVSAIPEPGTWVLFGLGLLATGAALRRRGGSGS